MILVVGSANLDFTVRVPQLPAPGQTVLGGDLILSPGGKGANQAVAAARAGGNVTFLGALGADAHADMLLNALHAAGVNTSLVRRTDAPTGVALIGVADGGENSIIVSPGANAHLSGADLPDLSAYTTVLLQLEVPLSTVSAAARAGREAGARVILNAAPAAALPADLLRDLSVLIVNEGELRALGGQGEVPAAARQVRDLGPDVVIVTLGARGSLAVHADGDVQVHALRVNAVDTVGAGDTFAGVLATFLDEDADLPTALRAANAAAALAVTRPGAQEGMPTRPEIDTALKD